MKSRATLKLTSASSSAIRTSRSASEAFCSEILPSPRRLRNAFCSLLLNESNIPGKLGQHPKIDKCAPLAKFPVHVWPGGNSKGLDSGTTRRSRPPPTNKPGGRILKWPTRADCKSAGLCLRRFESFSYHHLFLFGKNHDEEIFEESDEANCSRRRSKPAFRCISSGT